jgi:hypothetical protein
VQGGSEAGATGRIHLEDGNAVVESGGDFGTYLQGVFCIIATWLEGPSFLDFEEAPDEAQLTIRVDGLIEDLDRFEHT